MLKLRIPIGAGLMLLGAIFFVIGILSATAPGPHSEPVPSGYGVLSIVLLVFGTLAEVSGLFLLFSRKLGKQ